MPPARAPASRPPGPVLLPCLMLRSGEVCLPGPDGPETVRDAERRPLDPFDALDRVAEKHDRLYLVDLDGIERGVPQVEYIQEFSRELDLWVAAGVRTAEAAIDILVAGAQKAVLSTGSLRTPAELKRAWRLSTDWALEVELGADGRVLGSDRWARDPVEAVGVARAVGIADVVLSPRDADPDWRLVGEIAPGGRTWVDGTFTEADASRLAMAGAAGGIFHIGQLLAAPLPAPAPLTSSASARQRDDEN